MLGKGRREERKKRGEEKGNVSDITFFLVWLALEVGKVEKIGSKFSFGPTFVIHSNWEGGKEEKAN